MLARATAFRAILAVLAALITGSAFSAASSSAAVYWGSPTNGIGAANLDGTQPQWNYFFWPFTDRSAGPACGVAVSDSFVYWAGAEGIGRRRFEGENVYPTTIVPGLPHPCGIAVDQSHVYWGTFRGTSLGRANLDGSERNDVFVDGLKFPCDVAVGGGKVFWAEEGGIGRANLDGTGVQREFVSMPVSTTGCGLTVAGQYLYWAQGGAIARMKLDGTGYEAQFIAGVGDVEGIATDGGHIYWVGRPPGSYASIGRANLDGSAPALSWIPSSEFNLGGVAVDARPTPPLLTLPSRPIRFLPKASFNLRSGAALVGVYVPGQGELTVTSPGLSWTVFRSTVPLPSQANSYLWYLRVRPGAGKVGQRIRTQLRKRGWAKVKVRATYTQDRVYPTTEVRKLTLHRYPGAPGGWVEHPKPPKSSHR